ncbi:unnamed protein product [Prorocentrum cordatum]|uniref:DUF7869 domain-containing protein n=1 Tax=Prorocentrum cordatum TaxID=2364126 RepID=A0ABN9XZ65_9DINO|nr:unnamed protein product [Polarella glacialis]
MAEQHDAEMSPLAAPLASRLAEAASRQQRLRYDLDGGRQSPFESDDDYDYDSCAGPMGEAELAGGGVRAAWAFGRRALWASGRPGRPGRPGGRAAGRRPGIPAPRRPGRPSGRGVWAAGGPGVRGARAAAASGRLGARAPGPPRHSGAARSGRPGGPGGPGVRAAGRRPGIPAPGRPGRPGGRGVRAAGRRGAWAARASRAPGALGVRAARAAAASGRLGGWAPPGIRRPGVPGARAAAASGWLGARASGRPGVRAPGALHGRPGGPGVQAAAAGRRPGIPASGRLGRPGGRGVRASGRLGARAPGRLGARPPGATGAHGPPGVQVPGRPGAWVSGRPGAQAYAPGRPGVWASGRGRPGAGAGVRAFRRLGAQASGRFGRPGARKVDPVREETEVELPESVDEEEDDTVYSKSCNCKSKCYKQFSSKEIVESKQAWACIENETERKKKLFQAVTLEVKSAANQASKKIRKWTHKGKDVCRQSWAFINSTSSVTVDLYRKHVNAGGTEPPLNLPKMPGPRANTQSMKADTWFLALYDSLAEPCPTENAEEVKVEESHELIESPSHPLWILGAALDSDTAAPEKRYVPIRFLNPGNFETIWSQYQAEVNNEQQTNTAEMSDLWRPALHMTGVAVRGYLDGFFVMSSDQKKDSNMQATVLSRTLDVVSSMCDGRGTCMPRTLILGVDNTCRESKNQYFLTFLGWLKSTKKFDTIEVHVLQDPQEFCDFIKESVPKVADREILAEVLGGTCDFKEWVQQLNIKLSGLAATHQMHDPEVTHVWRIMSRELLKSAGFEDGAIECPDEWKDMAPGGHGSILLLKHFMSSSVYSQAPLLLLPEALAKNLQKDQGCWGLAIPF